MSKPTLTLDPYLTETLMRDLVGHDRRPAAFLVYRRFAGGSEATSLATLEV